MSRDLLVSQLRQGTTGNEILQILEVLTDGDCFDDSALDDFSEED